MKFAHKFIKNFLNLEIHQFSFWRWKYNMSLKNDHQYVGVIFIDSNNK